MNHRIAFADVFPKGHPKQGYFTYFSSNILLCLHSKIGKDYVFETELPKGHTIRPLRKKPISVGDTLTMYCWEEVPYRSKQWVFASDVKVTAVYGIVISWPNKGGLPEIALIDGEGDSKKVILLDDAQIQLLAKNDGLSLNDFIAWFEPKEFVGQVICWNPDIKY